jgi:quercetin dioxygenase-like cupin family protein
MTQTKLSLALALALVACTTAAADTPKKTPAADQKAGDPAVVAKDVYKLLLDNDRVRVFDVRFKPGQRAEMHSHPDHVVFVIDDATLRLTGSDGKSQDVSVKAGQALFLPAGPHAAENIGKTAAHNVVIELKPGK